MTMANCKDCQHHIYWKEEGKKDNGQARWVPYEDVGLTTRHECPNRNHAPRQMATQATEQLDLRAEAVDASGVSLLRIDQKLDHIITILESLGVQL
jgi:hypothetical protein